MFSHQERLTILTQQQRNTTIRSFGLLRLSLFSHQRACFLIKRLFSSSKKDVLFSYTRHAKSVSASVCLWSVLVCMCMRVRMHAVRVRMHAVCMHAQCMHVHACMHSYAESREHDQRIMSVLSSRRPDPLHAPPAPISPLRLLMPTSQDPSAWRGRHTWGSHSPLECA